MKHTNNITIGISIGDLNGIGGEIVLKSLKDNALINTNTVIIFASENSITYLLKHFNIHLPIHYAKTLNNIKQNAINVVEVWTKALPINFGKVDNQIGAYAIKSLKAATKALKNKHIDVLITAPINKESIQSSTFNFPGHTNYLAQELQGNALMFMVSNQLKIGLLTDHIPLHNVQQTITPALIKEKATQINQSLIQDFKINNPKIALLGLNPHAGDNGVIGSFDDAIIKPTLAILNKKNIHIKGPFAADSFFGSNTYKMFDAILACYHDQGLIPFKTLAFGKGVNYTAGLNKVRTSPDHGTAFNIAGKGIANEASFKEAILTGIKIFENKNNLV